ncbi:MAG: ECF RNA polymerase sigma factor SigW [Bacteroidetes bacterium ADurb.BinA261]|jgi:RNA polymerase sigma-70 factor (ECF subfamily)|nr:MAG: ECF RNA polymerase sigma factor SigW [Bacteroidetes bacterium ADurb.BinA261]HRS41890.1 sigma-70 family RNA polymerase sigma factor [Dysgonamonadaceae bacterium]
MGKKLYSDEELLSLLREPDTIREGFAKLVSEYSEQLYWQIRKMVLSHDDANDILQEVFIKAWSSIDNFRGEAKLSTWLYRIAINESITFINKMRAQNNISIDEDDSFLINQLEGDQYFDGDETQKLLQKAVLTLPEKQRLVFQMKYFDEMKYEEMSEILGTSVGALKASYHHAVKKIENFFDQID